MINIEKYLDKAAKQYLLEENVEKFIFPIKHQQIIKENFKEFEKFLAKNPYFHIIEHRDVKEGFVKVGRPSKIALSCKDLLKLRPYLKKVKDSWQLLENKCHLFDFKKFCQSNYSLCFQNWEKMEILIDILNYLHTNKEKLQGLYPRQISHGLSSKILGKESFFLRLYGEYQKGQGVSQSEVVTSWNDIYQELGLKNRPVPFQFYTQQIQFESKQLDNFHGILTATNFKKYNLPDFKNILIVENEESFYPLHGQLPETLIILGSGKRVHALKFITPAISPSTKIYYWGDIDKEGLEIFAGVYQIFHPKNKIIPLLMDMETIKKYDHLKQVVKKTYSADLADTTVREIPLLQAEYNYLLASGILIEQEQIPLHQVRDNFSETAS